MLASMMSQSNCWRKKSGPISKAGRSRRAIRSSSWN